MSQLSFAYPDYEEPPRPRRRVCDLPVEDRPLLRLQRHGAAALAAAELLALVLGTADAPGLAADLLQRFTSLHGLARASHGELLRVHGIGEAQAARLLAVLELSRRLAAPPADERVKIASPADAAQILLPRMRHLEQEELHVMLLNTRNQVIDIAVVYKGSLNTSVVRVGEIFRVAIAAPAAAIIVAHNHPSMDPSPSPEDVHVTRQIVEAGRLLDIQVLDHLIIGHSYVSLKERSLGFD